jgi:hypothetical protein
MMNAPSPSQLEMSLSGDDALAVLRPLHRAPDSVIGFTRKREGGGWENLFSLRLDELEAMFPAIASWLIKDAYFTVNGMYRAAPYTHQATGLNGVWRKEKHLRYLNACYVDLDCGRPDSPIAAKRLTWRFVAAALGEMMDVGLLPQSSMFARSGRGVYVFWALRDDKDPEMPPRYWPERLTLYKKINRAITKRLEHLAADISATDAARVLRVPGTVHSGASSEAAARGENTAVYQVQHDGSGRTFTYTLRELAEFFGVREMGVSLPSEARELAHGGDWAEIDEARQEYETAQFTGRETKNAGIAPNRARGYRIMHAARASDLVVLEQARGGWAKGRRKWHLTKYAEFLRGAGIEMECVLASVKAMAANCKPAYPSDANDTAPRAIVTEVFSRTLPKYSNETLCDWLGVNTQVARELDLLSIVPDEVREERKPPAGGERERARLARLDFGRHYLARGGKPTARELAKACKAAGIKSNPQTANEDLAALGLHARPVHLGRPTKAAQGTLELMGT